MGALIDGPVQRSRSVPHPRRSDLKQSPPAVPKFLWSLTTKADGDLESYDSMDDEVAFVFVIKLAIAAAPNCGAVQWRRAPSKLPNGVRLEKRVFY